MGLYSQDREPLFNVNSSTNSEWIDIVRSADDILTEIGAESGACASDMNDEISGMQEVV